MQTGIYGEGADQPEGAPVRQQEHGPGGGVFNAVSADRWAYAGVLKGLWPRIRQHRAVRARAGSLARFSQGFVSEADLLKVIMPQNHSGFQRGNLITASVRPVLRSALTISDSFAYNPNTGRKTNYIFTVGGRSMVSNLTWNANGTLRQLAITDPFNSANNQTCTDSMTTWCA